MNSLKFFFAALVAVLFAACAPDGHRAAAIAPDLSGNWTFSVDVAPDRVTVGTIVLEPSDAGYKGALTTNQGENVLPVSRFTLAGDAIAMIVESPDGAVSFVGVLADGAQAFNGTVTYHNGSQYPLSASRAASPIS